MSFLDELDDAAPAGDKPHLSISQLTMLARCGEQYRFRYIERVKAPPGVALLIGKGAHVGVERNLGEKMRTGSLLPLAAVKDAAADATRAVWQETPPIVHEGDPGQGEAVDTAVALVAAHHVQLAPSIEPVALERGFVLELPGFPFNLMGFVDIDEPKRIRDTKTAAKSPSGSEADQSDQLTLYHLEAAVRGEHKTVVALDYLVKTKLAKVVTLESTRNAEDHVRLLRRVEAAARVVQSGAVAPTNPDNWWCSAKWCGYYESHCAYGKRGRVVSGPSLIDPARLTSRS